MTTNLVLLKPKLQELREKIGATALEKERSAFTAYASGFAMGSLIELVGPAKTEVMALFLKEHPDMRVAWVEPQITVNPYALFQKGVNLSNVLFIEAQNEMTWCLSQALEAGCFQVIIADGTIFSERELRRFQLLSERRNTHFFLLSQNPHKSWVPHLQVEAKRFGADADGPSAGVHLHVLRRRGTG